MKKILLLFVLILLSSCVKYNIIEKYPIKTITIDNYKEPDFQYTEMKKKYPDIGVYVKNSNVSGKVVSHNLFKNSFVIETKDKTLVEVLLEEYESNK